MKTTLKIDLSPSPDLSEAKEKLTVDCSGAFKEFVELFCRVQRVTITELCHRYILEGMQSDLETLFKAQPHMNKTLRELLS